MCNSIILYRISLKSGGSSTKNPTPKKVPPKPKCPEKIQSQVDGKPIYSFTDFSAYMQLVSTAKASALSAVSCTAKYNAVARAKKSMTYFDNALASFQSLINYSKDNMFIKMDYLVTAVLDVAVKIVREYNEPKYINTIQIPVGAFSIAFKVISPPNTVDRNIMFINLVNSEQPWDLKVREPWKKEKLGDYMFNGAVQRNDYLGNYMYGVVAKEMFADINLKAFGYNIGTDSYIVNAAGLAQQWSDNGKPFGTIKWLLISASSGYDDTGDNAEDTEMIEAGIERWYRDYK